MARAVGRFSVLVDLKVSRAASGREGVVGRDWSTSAEWFPSPTTYMLPQSSTGRVGGWFLRRRRLYETELRRSADPFGMVG